MKKKALEKIPFKELQGPIEKKYKIIACVKSVEKQKHLIVDLYEKDSSDCRYPRYRICINKKEYANFDFLEKKWNTKKIENLIEYCYWKDIEIEEDNKKNIASWNDHGLNKYSDVIYEIDNIQSKIKAEKTNRAYNLRMKKIEELGKEIKSLPRDFNRFLKENVFYKTGYIFYEFSKNRKNASGTCSICGKYIEFDIKKEVPKHNEKGTCPKCKRSIIYKASGKQKLIYDKENAIYMQKTVKGFVSRYFEVGKHSEPGEKETIYKAEIARVYYDGSRTYTHYNLVDGWTGRERWYDKNYAGMYHLSFGEGVVYSKNLNEVFENTTFKYCALKELAEHKKAFAIKHDRFMCSYESHRFIEMFIKMGLFNLTNEYVGSLTDDINEDGKSATEILEISKEKIKRLIEVDGSVYELNLLQLEEKNKIKITDEQIDFIKTNSLDLGSLKSLLDYTTITKFVNYIRKPVGYGTLEERISHYFDYFEMAKKLNYDLNNSIKIMPKNLRKEHNEAVLRTNTEKENQRIREQNEKYPNIKKISKKANKKFFFEDDQYFIRTPFDAGEIVKEGNFLHHCVGGSAYIPQMNEEKTYILFMRRKDEPEHPYYTLEVKNNELKQCCGLNDKKPDWEEVKGFIEAFELNKLKKKAERIAS